MSTKTWNSESGHHKIITEIVEMKCPSKMDDKHYRKPVVHIRVTKETVYFCKKNEVKWRNYGYSAVDVSCPYLSYQHNSRPVTKCTNHIDHDGAGGWCRVVNSCVFDGELGYAKGAYVYKSGSVRLP